MINTEDVIRMICDKQEDIGAVSIEPIGDGFCAATMDRFGEENHQPTTGKFPTVHAALNALLAEKEKMLGNKKES